MTETEDLSRGRTLYDASSPATETRNVSLVIPVRDEARSIEPLIESIELQTRQPDEVVFVDGGSRDGTLEILRDKCRHNPRFRLIEARKALPGQGRNIGVANADFDWIAFTDAGNRLEADWLKQLVAAADADPEAEIICGNFKPVTDTFFKTCADIAYLPINSSDERGLLRGLFIASTMVRLDVWHAAGGFPDLRAAEDLMFFEEIERKGFKFAWAPRAFVYWQMQPTLRKTFRRFFVYSAVNVWARRQRFWHYGVARLYALAVPFLVLAAWKSAWWLLVPVAGLCVRVLRNIWLHREGRGFWWVMDPRRFAYVLVITLAVDLATFTAWIAALLNRSQLARTKEHMRTRRGDRVG